VGVGNSKGERERLEIESRDLLHPWDTSSSDFRFGALSVF